MKTFGVWIAVFCVLFLIGQLRLGGVVEYSSDGLSGKVRIGKVLFQVYPSPKPGWKHRAKKSEKAKNATTKASDQTDPKGGTFAQFKRYIPLIAETAGELRQRIVIERIDLKFIAAASDPMMAAMTFGYTNAAIGMILPVLEQNFTVKEYVLSTNVDFHANEPTIYVLGSVSIRLRQLIELALRLFVGFVRRTKKNV